VIGTDGLTDEMMDVTVGVNKLGIRQ